MEFLARSAALPAVRSDGVLAAASAALPAAANRCPAATTARARLPPSLAARSATPPASRSAGPACACWPPSPSAKRRPLARVALVLCVTEETAAKWVDPVPPIWRNRGDPHLHDIFSSGLNPTHVISHPNMGPYGSNPFQPPSTPHPNTRLVVQIGKHTILHLMVCEMEASRLMLCHWLLYLLLFVYT